MSSDGVGAIFWEGAREEHITPLFGYAGISGPVVVVVFRDRIICIRSRMGLMAMTDINSC